MARGRPISSRLKARDNKRDEKGGVGVSTEGTGTTNVASGGGQEDVIREKKIKKKNTSKFRQNLYVKKLEFVVRMLFNKIGSKGLRDLFKSVIFAKYN